MATVEDNTVNAFCNESGESASFSHVTADSSNVNLMNVNDNGNDEDDNDIINM